MNWQDAHAEPVSKMHTLSTTARHTHARAGAEHIGEMHLPASHVR